MKNTDTDTTTTASAQPDNRARFGQSFIGCVLDGSASSADYINERTINFAKSYGFECEDFPDEESEEALNGDLSEMLSEEGDNAVAFLNDQDLLPYCYFSFEDNSLFYGPYIENVREEVDFVSSRKNDHPPDDYEGEWLHVSDHGNATLYVRDDKANDTEIWSIV